MTFPDTSLIALSSIRRFYRCMQDLARSISCKCLVHLTMFCRAAWVACGRPNGETAIQNIRQRGRKRAAEEAEQLPEEPEPEPEPEPVREKKQRKVYQNARQTEQENARKRKRDDERKKRSSKLQRSR